MPSRFAVVGITLVAALLAGAPVAAGETCPGGGANNPAFGGETACPPLPRVAKPAEGSLVKQPDGSMLHRFGDTTVNVSGYVQADIVRSSGSGR